MRHLCMPREYLRLARLVSVALLVERHLVQDQAAPDFLHRNPLGLARIGPVRLRRGFIVAQTRQGTAAQLLRAHGRHVDEQESAVNGSRLRARRWWSLELG